MFVHYSPITNDKKPNLLPIVFPVLEKLGFEPELRRSLLNAYIDKYEIKDLNSVYFVANDFENHYLKRLATFRERLNERSSLEILSDYLKDKKRSMSSCDFWALARIASAVVEGEDERIVQALAFYDCIAKELKISGGKVFNDNHKNEFIALMQKRRHFRGLSLAKTAEEKIRIIIKNQDSLIKLPVDDDNRNLEKMMLETFVEWYLMTEDNYVRSVLIGFHSLYKLRNILSNYCVWLREFWVQAQVFSIMTNQTILWKKMDLLSWEELEEKACQLKHLDDIYLFYVLHDFNNSIKIELLRRSAQTLLYNSKE